MTGILVTSPARSGTVSRLPTASTNRRSAGLCVIDDADKRRVFGDKVRLIVLVERNDVAVCVDITGHTTPLGERAE